MPAVPEQELPFDELSLVVEGLLFAAGEPVRPGQIAQVYEDVAQSPAPSEADVRAVIEALNARYEVEGRAFRIETWAGGYRMATVPQVAPFIEKLRSQVQPRRLSRSLLETAAIIAYKQPVSKAEVDFVRGVDADYAVRKLLEIGLIDVVGRSDSLGRPLLYGTTPYFLDQFGLHRLEDLPRLREIEELINDPGFSRERAKLLFSEGVQQEAQPERGSDAD